tara:strand:+ start:123 stop:680 length:558 start_codon:yes stop_codon:yes gene_type:complete
MEIKKYIKIYDKVLPWNVLSNLIRSINQYEFKSGTIGPNGVVNKKIRQTNVFEISNRSDDMAKVHWHNILFHVFMKHIGDYMKNHEFAHMPEVNSIQILKYGISDHYEWHVDHFKSQPRTISCIFLLNNDYEGGHLCFKDPFSDKTLKVDNLPNRLIVWPSNFMFPHTVKPITKGIRYSIVSWAL